MTDQEPLKPAPVKRRGKLRGVTRIIIPYSDSDGVRQYVLIQLIGTMYASKVYAGIKQYVREAFGAEVDDDWLLHVPYIMNQYDPGMGDVFISSKKRFEAFIDSIEDKTPDEDDDQTHPTDEGNPSERAE